MSDIDPNQEWTRLTEVYRQMADEELLHIAAQPEELTDVAREVLQGEIRTRSLKLETPQAEPERVDRRTTDFDPVKLDLVLLNRYFDRADAVWAKGVMQWAEIPIYFGASLLEDPTAIASYEYGIDAFVLRHDYARAVGAFQTSPLPRPSEEPEAEEAQAADAACCPQCGSFEIVLLNVKNGSNGEQVYHWRCDACGRKWTDDGVAQYKPLPQGESEENL